ncbi:MAG: hypothetical protein JW727_00010 [Candidatus Aenigmarchaeota archaeon]|nr:hypothetical protein [Candidatus Aenigmarchaeota archaeon]
MELDDKSREICILLFLSLMIFLGFYLFYAAGMSLDYLIRMNAELPEKMVMSAQGENASFVVDLLMPVFMSITSLLCFCAVFAALSVRTIGKIHYATAIPIIVSGVLFGFSIMYLFFAAGLFAASIYSVPLGETYRQELKKWREFRVGSNTASKALFVLFLFVFAGSYIALSHDGGYKDHFYSEVKLGVAGLVQREVDNSLALQGASNEEYLSASMAALKSDNPALTDAEIRAAETAMREGLSDQEEDYAASRAQVDGLVESSLENSPLMGAILFWFPLVFSFTIWAFLELLRGTILSPAAGVFSYVFFRIGASQDGSRGQTQTLKQKPKQIGYKIFQE